MNSERNSYFSKFPTANSRIRIEIRIIFISGMFLFKNVGKFNTGPGRSTQNCYVAIIKNKDGRRNWLTIRLALFAEHVVSFSVISNLESNRFNGNPSRQVIEVIFNNQTTDHRSNHNRSLNTADNSHQTREQSRDELIEKQKIYI